MKTGNFPFLSLQQNFPLVTNDTFNSLNVDRNEKNLYFFEKKISSSLNKKSEQKQSKEEVKLNSDNLENFKKGKNNLFNRKKEEIHFSEDEENFNAWKKKQINKMNEEIRNALRNNKIFLQQKSKKKTSNRNENQYFSSAQSLKIIKENDNIICENDSKFIYFTNLDSIVKREKLNLEGKY